MVLVIDIGNTNITLGAYDGEKLMFVSRMYTQKHKTSDEFAVSLLDVFALYKLSPTDFEGVVLSSVVPEITEPFAKAVEMTTGKTPLCVGKQYNGNLKVEVLPIEYLGADLICDCVGAIKKYPLPCLIIDMGTATKILAVDKDEYFLGCTISPGVRLSLEALASSASMLPLINLEEPKHVVGTNTVECMQSGIVYGNASMLDGLVEKIKEELGFENPTVVATGGYSQAIISCCKSEIIFDENLILDGLKAIYDKAKNN